MKPQKDQWRIEWTDRNNLWWRQAMVRYKGMLMYDSTFSTLEEAITLLKDQSYSVNWQIRIRNVVTGEVIPGEILEWKTYYFERH